MTVTPLWKHAPMRPDGGEEFAKALAAILPEREDATLIARAALARLDRDIREGNLRSWPETLAEVEKLSPAAQSILRKRFPLAFAAE